MPEYQFILTEVHAGAGLVRLNRPKEPNAINSVLMEELVTALIRSLPKSLRVSFVPAPNKAREFLAAVPAGDESLLDALERWLRSTTGVVVPRSAWDWAKVPDHLRPTFRVVDEQGLEAGRGKDLEALKRQGVVVGVGYRGPNPKNKVVNPFAAQFCEVEVNTKTGELKILRFAAAHDSGRVMNRLTYDSQVFGGITMGIGLALTEARILDAGQTGKMVNRNWHDYKLPTALDVPADMTSIPIEPADIEANNTGAKGLGEPVTIPTAAAIANAVCHATGLRITQTPMHPLQLVQRLAGRRKEG